MPLFSGFYTSQVGNFLAGFNHKSVKVAMDVIFGAPRTAMGCPGEGEP